MQSNRHGNTAPFLDQEVCDICFLEVPESDMFQLKRCQHRFCHSCFEEFYRFRIEDQFKVMTMKCPQHGCPCLATEDEISQIVSTDCFKKLLRLRLNQTVLTQRDKCFCATPNCETVLTRTKGPDIKCDRCQQSTCFTCKKRSHWNSTCA